MVAHDLARTTIYTLNPQVFDLLLGCIATHLINDVS